MPPQLHRVLERIEQNIIDGLGETDKGVSSPGARVVVYRGVKGIALAIDPANPPCRQAIYRMKRHGLRVRRRPGIGVYLLHDDLVRWLEGECDTKQHL